MTKQHLLTKYDFKMPVEDKDIEENGKKNE